MPPTVINSIGQTVNCTEDYAYALAYKFLTYKQCGKNPQHTRAVLTFKSAKDMLTRFNSIDSVSQSKIVSALRDNYGQEIRYLQTGNIKELQSLLASNKR